MHIDMLCELSLGEFFMSIGRQHFSRNIFLVLNTNGQYYGKELPMYIWLVITGIRRFNGQGFSSMVLKTQGLI